MNATFKKTFILFFAAIVAGVVFIAALFYRNAKDYEHTSQWVSHTQTVLEQAESIASLSKELQLESAGFYFTGDSAFLHSYTVAKADILQRLTVFKQLTADNSLQQQRIDSLQAEINKLILFSDVFVQTKNTGNFTGITGITENFFQRRVFREKIDSGIENIKKEENRLLLLRQAANFKSDGVVFKTFNVLIILVFILLTLGFVLMLIHLNKRKKAEEELRKSNERFDLLVNNIKDFAMFMLDNDGNIISSYSDTKRIKEYTDGEIIGKPVSIFYTEEDVRMGVPQHALKKAAENGFYVEEGWRITRDGTRYWADVIMTAIHNKDGDVIGFTKVTRDVTLQKKAADEMRHALEMAKELNNMKSNFVSMASHEFRTPLTSILTSAILVEQYKNEDEQDKRERHTKKIRTSVATLTSILEDFLSLEKIESGRLQVKTQTFNLQDFTAGICSEAKNTAKSGQTIAYQHEGSEEVHLDKGFMRHIITNLVSNALKYSLENAHVAVFTSVHNNKVLLRVKDTGIGISAEDQKHLFERFYRASNAGNVQGTGLGLHIIKRYIDVMNGTITINSEPEKGSEFIVELESKTSNTQL